MIDSHIHVVDARLPGEDGPAPRLDRMPDALAVDLRREMVAAGVDQALGMGCWGSPADDPLGINGTVRLAALVPGLHPVGVADPTRTHPDHLRRAEGQLKQGQVKALKAYLGYLHFGPDSPAYAPYYELAAKYEIPFIFHTGDTYSARAKLRYAHPLLVDEVAVDHPEVRFVMAHFGNPWLADAAEVVYKNDNVWADLSGLLVGEEADFKDPAQDAATRDIADLLGRALRYAEKPNRFLFGSDWPLAPIAPYRKFIESILPAAHRKLILEENARALFRLA